MIRSFYILSLFFLTGFVFLSCDNGSSPKLPSVEERVSEAKANLISELIAPANGWRLEYQPTPDGGVFFMLLKFTEDEVTIQSDVVDNDGEFLDHTIPYRIDNASSLELILETYGVFHYLFELDRANFGAEFEFLFRFQDGANLVFDSKTDAGVPTKLIFEPANAGDESMFSRDLAENLNAFVSASPQALVQVSPSQQLILEDQNISIFWVLDAAKRSIVAEVAAEGTDINQIVASGNIVNVNQATGYALLNGKLVLQDPISFVIGGQQVTINQIALNTFEMTGPSICSTGADNTAKYKGQIAGLGDVSIVSSLLSSRGSGFQANVYSIGSVFFIFDGDGNSLSDPGGIIADKFPTADGFLFLYGVQLTNPEIPIYSVGFTVGSDLYLREFQPSSTQINLVKVQLTNNFFFSKTPTTAERQGLIDITNQLFQGAEVYAFDFPQNSVFRLFNPCNQNEIFILG
ncbi:MAG: DUF4302 domain-containing protein [Cyclobacteriaceae bacterium]